MACCNLLLLSLAPEEAEQLACVVFRWVCGGGNHSPFRPAPRRRIARPGTAGVDKARGSHTSRPASGSGRRSSAAGSIGTAGAGSPCRSATGPLAGKAHGRTSSPPVGPALWVISGCRHANGCHRLPKPGVEGTLGWDRREGTPAPSSAAPIAGLQVYGAAAGPPGQSPPIQAMAQSQQGFAHHPSPRLEAGQESAAGPPQSPAVRTPPRPGGGCGRAPGRVVGKRLGRRWKQGPLVR